MDAGGKTIVGRLVLGMLLAMAGSGLAGDETARAQLVVHLTDGSRILGTPDLSGFPLQTSYAKMTIPLDKLRRIEGGDENIKAGETVAVHLRNDDRLQAVLLLDKLELTTLFGKIKVDLGHVLSIVIKVGTGAPGPRPLLPEHAGCLCRKAVPVDARCDALVTDAVIAENPDKYHGYKPMAGTDKKPPVEPDPSQRVPTAASATAKTGIAAEGPRWLYLDAWYISQPFLVPNRQHDSKFAPELGKDGAAEVLVGDLGIEGRGKAAKWELVKSTSPACRPKTAADASVWYAYTEVYSPVDQTLTCIFGTDDYGKVWINGRIVYVSGTAPHPWTPDRGIATVPFKKGYNTVFFKFENTWGRTAFSACINVADVK